MKKIISRLLAVCLLLCLVGCKKDAPANSNTEPTDEPVSTEPIVLDAPFLAVGLPAITDSITAEDGTTIFTASQPYMTLTMEGQATADLIINDFMNRVSNAMSTAETIKAAATAAYSDNTTNWTPYSIEINYTPIRIDPNVLSLYGTIVSYSGGVHPDYACVSANYNMISGDPLTLGSILTHEDAIPKLRDLLIRELEAQADDKFLREDFQNDIIQRFEKDVSFDEEWYFSETGLCFYFAPYQIAPYSSGVIIAEIPYSELIGIIEDAYFPAEVTFSNGNATVHPFAADTGYAMTSELILDHNGDKFFVEADSCIQNIQIVEYSALTGRNDIAMTRYSAYCLNPGNAIMIQIPQDSNAAYFVEYQQNGSTIKIPISTQ